MVWNIDKLAQVTQTRNMYTTLQIQDCLHSGGVWNKS